MYESTNIYFNGVSALSLGLLFVRFANQDNSESFLSGREAVTDRIQKNNSHKSQVYLYGVKRQERKFSAEFFCDNMTDANKSAIAKWLDVQNYAPFYSTDNTDKIYYCLISGTPKFVTNGSQGIVSVDMLCQDEYSYSALKIFSFDYSLTIGVQTLSLTNSGDVFTSPVIEITVVGINSSVSICNTSNGNKTMTFHTDASGNQLINTEKIIVDCNKEIITTDRIATFRYDNMVGDFLDLATGINSIQVTGKCKLKFTYQTKYLT